MAHKAFRLDRKSAGAYSLAGLWGPSPPHDGRLLYNVAGRCTGVTRAGTGPIYQLSDRGRVPLYNGVDDTHNCGIPISTFHDDFTFMAWVWLDSTVPQDRPTVLGSGDGVPTDFAMFIDNGNNANAALNFRGVAIICEAPAGSFHAVKNSWVHVAAIRKHIPGSAGAHVHIYQDGVLVGSDLIAHSSTPDRDVLQIGSSFGRADMWWKGLIDDVRYYRQRALSIAQINWIYERTRYHPYADIAHRSFSRLIESYSNAK